MLQYDWIQLRHDSSQFRITYRGTKAVTCRLDSARYLFLALVLPVDYHVGHW